jgi:hypothetical protein
MYRYHVDHVVTYTPDDIVLFRDSPFAAWMERLTLENPEHGIPADLDSMPPHDGSEHQDDMVATLRAEGRHVVQIDWDLDEPDRRTATLAAMRAGADFIVNGQLALGTSSGRANLLMRTSGYSDLGDFLYIPCATRSANTFQSAFRLCFFADLLHALQGQLPPQLLIIRDGAEVVPLQTEDHIYFYRAVQQRFKLAMTNFRKHKMPDPAESAHFGRWSDCASEVLKQRALGELQRAEESHSQEQTTEPVPEAAIELPQLRVASGAGGVPAHYSTEAIGQTGVTSGTAENSSAADSASAPRGGSGQTLAEQALLLAPDSFRSGAAPGHTPNLARFGGLSVSAVPERRDRAHARRSSDAALQNLEFIGSTVADAPGGSEPPSRLDDVTRAAPAPTLREAPPLEDPVPEQSGKSAAVGLPELEPRPPVFLPPDQKIVAAPPRERLPLTPLDSDSVAKPAASVIDMDSAPPAALAPVVQRAEAEFARIGLKDPMFRRHEQSSAEQQADASSPSVVAFSSSLITGQELSES